ncbi:PAS domain S-box protein [Thiohalomonas denitrificans]|uniref:PAS domain S-box-containing protein/diguanylate cyclase (GGDEF) domain-containing protein n=1 Tax=Thiohalomonas denitrificans TaxID=415747 RepID=A0A1G5PYQ5_9GAMM|nr:PAS domain S-box protein [Thiohalomonas denitrificans]SCZ54714.1 PAS domain S-box-containing protein/diguanylate cyclase (GGDEF) domain-containing protein [Thiohalomonas denitrificans]
MEPHASTIHLKVLLVEDSEDDAFLLMRELRKGGYSPEYRQVDCLSDVETALSESWDLVLSDYSLPGFTALDVLRLLGRFALDLPFIVVSGAVGEETVINTIHAGAHNYIMKDNLARLNSAVERELGEAEGRRQRRRAELALQQSEEHFRQLAGNIDGVLWLIDLDEERMIYVNPGFEQIWERPATTLFGALDEFLDFVHPEDYDRIESILVEKGWVGLNDEYRIQRPDGSERWLATHSFPIRDESGRIYRCAGLTRDVTARKQAEQEREKLFRALEQTADMVMITNRDGVIEYVNAAFEDVTGYQRQDVTGKQPSILSSGIQDPDFFTRMWRALTNGLPFTDLFINRRKDGDLYYEAKTITPVRDEHGDVTHFVATGKDVTRRLARQESLQHLVGRDALTGLGNRVLFVERLSRGLLSARRTNESLAVMCVGIDLSGLLGEAQMEDLGERLLTAAAHRIKKNLDRAEGLARLKREQFAAIISGVDDSAELEVIAQQLIDAFSEPVEADGYQLFLTLSVGISVFPNDGEETESLMRHAETAMQHTRATDRAGYGFFNSGMSFSRGEKPLSS